MNENNHTVVVFTGEIGTGKTAVAQALAKARCNVKVRSFAGALKKVALAFGFPQESLYGSQAQKLARVNTIGCSGREFLQQFGTSLCRKNFAKAVPGYHCLDPEGPWATVLYNTIVNEYRGGKAFTFIDDMRFPSELAAMRKLAEDGHANVCVIRIRRQSAIDAHNTRAPTESESHYDYLQENADHVVENDHSLEDLIRAITKCIPDLPEPELLLMPCEFTTSEQSDPRFAEIEAASDEQVDATWSGTKIKFDGIFRTSMRNAPLPLQYAMAHILAFFGEADDVIERFCANLGDMIQHPIVRRYLTLQGANECEHAAGYSMATKQMPPKWIERAKTLVKDREGPIGAKIAFLKENMGNDDLASAVMINALLETGFMCIFNFIFYLGEMGAKPGPDGYSFNDFVDLNTMISRDEKRHAEAFVSLYKLVNNKLGPKNAKRICQHLFMVETEFCKVVFSGHNFFKPWTGMTTEELNAIPLKDRPFPGLSWKTVEDYNHYMANTCMIAMGYDAPWPEINTLPAPHMKPAGAENVNANFERSAGVDYTGSAADNGTIEEIAFAMNL